MEAEGSEFSRELREAAIDGDETGLAVTRTACRKSLPRPVRRRPSDVEFRPEVEFRPRVGSTHGQNP